MRNIWICIEISISSCPLFYPVAIREKHLSSNSWFVQLFRCFISSKLLKLRVWWSDFPLHFYLCLVKAVSLLNICWPVRRRSSCFRNVKRLFAEPVRRSIRQSLCLSLRQIAASLEDSCSVLKCSVLLYTPSASTAWEIHRETDIRNKTLWEKTFNRSTIMRRLKHTVMKRKGLTFNEFIFRPIISRNHLNVSLRWSLMTVSYSSAIENDRRLSFVFDIRRRRDKARQERRWDPSSSWFLRLSCRWSGCLWKYQVKWN